MDGESPVTTTKLARLQGCNMAGHGDMPSSIERKYISGRNRTSEIVVTARANGGVSISQGPAYILIGPDESDRLIEAMELSIATGDV